MRIFMLGWEFPPFISGGLGTACAGLTKALDELGVEVTFVLPAPVGSEQEGSLRMVNAGSGGTSGSQTATHTYSRRVSFRTIGSLLQPYSSPGEYEKRFSKTRTLTKSTRKEKAGERLSVNPDVLRYGGDMFAEVQRYAAAVLDVADGEQFDVIHAHDWMTYPAGVSLARATGKPLVVHIHSTEFDRSGENVNQRIYDIERMGMHAADKVIAVSHWTRSIVVSRYGVAQGKIEVVYNGVQHNGCGELVFAQNGIRKGEKIVLFLGRVTMQKGPDYFLAAAKRVLEVMDNVKFVVAGSGDMLHRIIEHAARLGIGHKVLFTGFLRGEDVAKVYKMADLYVMPSVSEPFGIAPLEAMDRDVPVLISKQSGVSEVLQHVLKVDFWDVNEMANKIVAVLKYPPLGMTLRQHGNFEVRKLRWADAARRCADIYEQARATAAV